MLIRHFKLWAMGIGCAAFAALGYAQPKTIELEFPSWQIEEAGAGEYWTELIKAFEAKNPNVKIKKQQVPFREYVDKTTIRFAGNNPPDIVHLPTRNYLAFASQGWLAPLDEYLAQTDVKATYMKLNDEMLYNGKYYGVLMMGYGMMFFYNDKLLSDAKVAVPKTSDELLKAIAAATDVNAGRFGYGAPTNEHPNVFVEISTWVTGEGASLFKGNQYNFTDPAVIRAIDKFRTAVKGAPKGTSSEQARQLFIDGKIAMIRDGPWVAAAGQEGAGCDAAQSQDGHDAVRECARGDQQFAAHAGQARSGKAQAGLGIHQDDHHTRMAGEVHAAHVVAGAAQECAARGGNGRPPRSRDDQQGRRGGGQPVPGGHRGARELQRVRQDLRGIGNEAHDHRPTDGGHHEGSAGGNDQAHSDQVMCNPPSPQPSPAAREREGFLVSLRGKMGNIPSPRAAGRGSG